MKKIILLAILCIFIVGMALSPVAAKTFKSNGYKYKMSDHKFKYMKKEAKNQAKQNKYDHYGSVSVVKYVPKYKTKNSYKSVPVGHKLTKWSKVVKCTPKSNYYKLKIKQMGQLSCYIDWENGKYRYYAYGCDLK